MLSSPFLPSTYWAATKAVILDTTVLPFLHEWVLPSDYMFFPCGSQRGSSKAFQPLGGSAEPAGAAEALNGSQAQALSFINADVSRAPC